jgi:hypothetical protein
MHAAAAAAKAGKTAVMVDINWRPVFWQVGFGWCAAGSDAEAAGACAIPVHNNHLLLFVT